MDQRAWYSGVMQVTLSECVTGKHQHLGHLMYKEIVSILDTGKESDRLHLVVDVLDARYMRP